VWWMTRCGKGMRMIGEVLDVEASVHKEGLYQQFCKIIVVDAVGLILWKRGIKEEKEKKGK